MSREQRWEGEAIDSQRTGYREYLAKHGPPTAANRTVDRRTVLKTMGVASVVAGIGAGMEPATAQPEPDDPPRVRGSMRQVKVTGLVPGTTVTLYDGDTVIDEAEARFPDDPEPWFDSASFVFRDVPIGEGYTVTQTIDGQESPRSEPVDVFDEDYVPPQDFYDEQELTATEPGEIGYIEMRDGTTLAHQTVHPPAETAQEPYPTIVIYSGYAPSVNLPGSDVIIETIVEEMGYAIVAVNKRGTQCSGGKFDFFEWLQIYDGYDIIEAVAAQDWADGVGMAGGSYSGYSQFYVAATQPPSLDAIAPGMPVGDFYRDVGYPGGILNTTFAATWAGSRDESARHDTDGRGDSTSRAQTDEVCRQNQLLRPNNVPTLGRMEASPYIADFYMERSPWNLVEAIDVPTFLNVSWQDEQVGSRAARLQERFADDIDLRFVAGNGDHNIYLYPDVVADLMRFFDYYVRGEIPEPDRDTYDDFESALADYQAEDPIKIYWEIDQSEQPRFETSYEAWPPADETWELYFQPDGTLDQEPPADDQRESSSYEFVSESFLMQQIGRDEEGRLVWEAEDDEEHVSFVSAPLESDHVCLGSGLVELYLRSSGADTDLQVSLAEVRPDGTEMHVQNGWLRASHRAEDEERVRERRPWHTHLEADAEPMPDGEFEHLRVEIHPFGHVFREGSRVKIAVDNPGGTRNLWGFDVLEEPTTNEVGHTAAMPSKLELPLISGAEAGVESLPPCGDVRNQPCREVDVDAIIRDIDDDADPDDDTADDPADGDSDDGPADDPVDEEPADDDLADDDDGFAPGFGVPAAISALGGTAYLIRNRLAGESEEE